jgi:hypothetical protein
MYYTCSIKERLLNSSHTSKRIDLTLSIPLKSSRIQPLVFPQGRRKNAKKNGERTFALLWEKGCIFIGERENTKPFPLPLFPTSLRSLLLTVNRQPSTINNRMKYFLLKNPFTNNFSEFCSTNPAIASLLFSSIQGFIGCIN